LQDHLSTIAEVAIGLAGFASLATVLRNQEQAEALLAFQRLLVLLFLSLSVVFLSLLAPLLLVAGFREATVWRFAAAAVAIILLFAFSPLSPLTRNLKRIRTAGRSRTRLYRDGSAYPTAGAAVVCALLTVGFFSSARPPIYVASVSMLLLSASVQFVRLMASLVARDAV